MSEVGIDLASVAHCPTVHACQEFEVTLVDEVHSLMACVAPMDNRSTVLLCSTVNADDDDENFDDNHIHSHNAYHHGPQSYGLYGVKGSKHVRIMDPSFVVILKL